VYFPILDRIADGYFDDSTTDEQLYNHFLHLLRSDQLITDPHSLSSINFALSIRNAAPRVEAHYHFYANKILPSLGRDCETWLELDGRQYCNPELKGENHTVDRTITQDLPFDRVLGPDSASVVATLYADITSQDFRKFHKTAVQSVQEGKSRYRIRHRHATESKRDPLVMSGYGVELALKRTDYIVIDDRQNTNKADKSNLGASKSKADSDEELADLTPLSASQLSELGVKAASFVASSENPFDTLLEITQDFPKHSASLAKQDVSAQFLEEHNENRATFLPEGYNVMWINGIQYDPRKMDVFSILDHLRRERRLVQSFRDMGLTSPEAIKLLSHPAIFEANTKTGSQRYDWRDANEGGDVILWLNNIEKDQRYKDWPDDLFAV
jgi:UDP-glucose:glycoprotein glucosyltransferase